MKAAACLLLMLGAFHQVMFGSGEMNVCSKTVHKTKFVYHRTTYGYNPVQIIWYPVQKQVSFKTHVCCEGWGQYERNIGCRLRLACPVRITQDSTSYCKSKCGLVCKHKQVYYHLNSPKKANDPTRTATDILVPILNQTSTTVRTYTMFNDKEAHWFNTYFLALLQGSNAIFQKASAQFGVKQFTTDAEFSQVVAYFNQGLKALKHPNIYVPTEYFLDVQSNGDWKLDRIFAAKRLGGMNPLSINQVTHHGKHGAKLSSLQKDLNPTFDWQAAVKAVTGMSLEDSVTKGLIYVVDFKLYRDLPHSPDITDRNRSDTRVLRRSTAPIGLFAMGKELMPVAIQYDYKKASNVYKPTDGNHWLLAKMQFEVADFVVGQLGDHLTGTHFMMERICIAAYRHFCDHHALGQLLHKHCVGTIPINSNGVPSLLHEFRIMHMLSAIGNVGSIEFVNRFFKQQHWRDFDPAYDMKRRGVYDHQQLPYYPYRDDGLMIYSSLKKYIKDYAHHYYPEDSDVFGDSQVQEFANEISLQGTGPNGGKGMVDGFPSKIKTHEALCDTLTKILFIVAQHSAANYPLIEFNQFVPLGPTKLYKDTAKLLTPFQSLPDSGVASFQGVTVATLAGLHYDQLLDYGDQMTDGKAKEIVNKHYEILKQTITPIIEKRNVERRSKKLFGYPYFIPKFITNSISV